MDIKWNGKGNSQSNKFESWSNLAMDFICSVTTGQKQVVPAVIQLTPTCVILSPRKRHFDCKIPAETHNRPQEIVQHATDLITTRKTS